ncbi:MAG TPA: hypothetical protein PLD59_04335, partial [Tepidisphaeraceae bacterium]|nr:hypothetical protein [Tepidisphaeraceae bacterium]
MNSMNTTDYVLFKATYRGGKSPNYSIRFRDHLRRRQKISAYPREVESHRLAKRVMELVESRTHGTQLDASTRRWLEGLDESTAARLAEMELIDPRSAFADKPLLDHLIGEKDAAGNIITPGYQQAMEAKGDTPIHVTKTITRIRKIVDDVSLIHFRDLIAPGASARVQHHLGEMRRKGEIGGKTLNYYVTAIKGFCRWLADEGRAPSVALEGLKRVENAEVDSDARRALMPEEMQSLLFWLDTPAAPERFGLTASERSILYRFSYETGIRPNQIRALTVSSFNLESRPATVTSQAVYVKRRRVHTQAIRPELAAMLQGEFAHRMPAATAFRMPDVTNLAKMFRADLADAREAWINAVRDDKAQAERRKSDFLAAENHQQEKAVFYSLRHGHGTALALAG